LRHAVVRAAILGWSTVVFVTLVLNALLPLAGHEQVRPWAAGLLAFPVASALLLLRRPTNPVGLLLGTVSTAAGGIFISLWVIVTRPGPWTDELEALSSPFVLVHFWAIIALLFVFPTGSPPDRPSRRAFAVFTWWLVAMVPLTIVRPGPLDVSGTANPLAVGPSWLAEVQQVGLFGLLLGVVAGVATVWRRRRAAGPVERAQLKWFTSGAGLILVVILFIAVVPESVDDAPLPRLLGYLLVLGAFWGLPAAIVAAVLQYRLYDIDRLVSRTVTYGAVVAIVLGVYAGTVVVLSSVLPAQGDLAVAASTLAAAALFDPARRRVQRSVDRRFDRPRYDAVREVERFVAHLRDEVHLDGLTLDLRAIVTTTMQPATVHVWFSPPVPDAAAAERVTGSS
jgi:small-conductance mechanosensitive channel